MSKAATLGSDVLLVHSKRPDACTPRGAMILFPGLKRNADDYLGRAEALARSQCLSLYAPEFTRRTFPRWRYQRGGVIRHGQLTDPSDCTGGVIKRLIAWVREQEGQAGLPITLFGHSAGAQLLSRVAAYCPFEGADRPSRIVIANPSGYAAATLDEAVPYGFAIPDQPGAVLSNAEQRLKVYLAQPITIYLGSRDTGRRRLNQEEAAYRQGNNRLDRGINVYRDARQVAEELRTPFHWRLVVAEGIGHSADGMLNAAEAIRAIQPETP